jgi:hypothetical protein
MAQAHAASAESEVQQRLHQQQQLARPQQGCDSAVFHAQHALDKAVQRVATLEQMVCEYKLLRKESTFSMHWKDRYSLSLDGLGMACSSPQHWSREG